MDYNITPINERNLQAVFVDAGGVLLKPDFEKIIRLAPSLPLTEEMIDIALYQNGEIGAGLGPGDNDDDFVYNFCIAAGLDDKTISDNFPELRDIVLFAPWIPRKLDEIHAFLNTLKQLNLKVVVVSNTEWGGVEELLDNLGICQVGAGKGVEIHTVIDSAEINIFKPDPRIYEFAAKKIDVPIKSCLHVGDSIRNDVKASLEAGAYPVYFSPFIDNCEHEFTTVTSLSELGNIITDEL